MSSPKISSFSPSFMIVQHVNYSHLTFLICQHVRMEDVCVHGSGFTSHEEEPTKWYDDVESFIALLISSCIVHDSLCLQRHKRLEDTQNNRNSESSGEMRHDIRSIVSGAPNHQCTGKIWKATICRNQATSLRRTAELMATQKVLRMIFSFESSSVLLLFVSSQKSASNTFRRRINDEHSNSCLSPSR